MSDQEKKETLLEAKILEKLDHPNIIRFREVFIAKKPRFTLNIVTDYADGGDLNGKIKAQKGRFFTENQILDWFTQICLALKHIHDKKILHRDLKSQNIFLTENGIIKLGDFGIAKCLECTWEKAMTVVGTPYYLSPEIVNNKPYSFKSDIWSLGVLLYEMTALRMPFDATSLPMLSLKIIKGNYIPLPQSFSKDLRNLVGMLLIVDYNKRPSINEILSKKRFHYF
jgi:NIMA (never in mitosis gene a)-related kinase 1/4/5